MNTQTLAVSVSGLLDSIAQSRWGLVLVGIIFAGAGVVAALLLLKHNR